MLPVEHINPPGIQSWEYCTKYIRRGCRNNRYMSVMNWNLGNVYHCTTLIEATAVSRLPPTVSLKHSVQDLPDSLYFYLFIYFHLTPDGRPHFILPMVTQDLPISPRFTPYDFLSRCKFSTLTTRQPMVVFYLLTLSCFPPLHGRQNKILL